ncbi:MAG: 16S rRNA (cytosine(1402)-N(4))-methyltransferase RsmH [Chlamydiales bacterium]|nr:16S rRNA (cytosine(1402)-N(4))-methyltransferase RsmH [Chlamydiales bacterium]
MHHQPILVKEFLSFFSEISIDRFIDGTVGAGGHARALLESHPEIERLYGFDRDPDALEIAGETLKPFQEKVTLVHANFLDFERYVPEPVEGIFLDLGVSSMQLDRPEKGFSLYKEGPLDMRMDPTSRLNAEAVVNSYSERDLGRIFQEYGEEPRWRAAAKALVEARRKKRLKTTTDLTEALKHVLTWGGRRGKKIHPMTLVFQALRIYVNDELKVLERALPKGIEGLAPGGRFGVLTFHSLEDRIVKQTFRRFAVEEKSVKVLTKKPMTADGEEVRRNPRSRSAKLRFIEKV